MEVARGPMLAVTEPGVHVISAMCGTQLLKTSLLENVFGYFAHLDPCPMLLVQPKDDAAQGFSKERIAPMIRASPVLRALVGTGKSRTGDDTLAYKAFPGGFLAIVGAGSRDNLARRAIRVAMFDEVDKYEGFTVGDPIDMGEDRTSTFTSDWLSIRVCSPELEGTSRIEREYNKGDQRRPSVACPHCGHRLFLDFWKHVDWDKDAYGEHRPETAAIYCEACGARWSEGDRLRATWTARWHQTRSFQCCGRRHSPLDAYDQAWRTEEEDPVGAVWDWWASNRHAVYRAKCPDCGKWAVPNEHASFQVSKLYTGFSKDRPSAIAARWLDSKDVEETKQYWWNSNLGLPYRPRIGRDIKPHELMDRREVWPGEVPAPVAVLTAGVDTQPDRLEVEVVGWGRGEESWSVGYRVLDGDPDLPAVWARLDELLTRQWMRADGRPLVIAAVCVDSGGSNTQAVYEYCRKRSGRRVWAIKGRSETVLRYPVWPTSKPNRKRIKDGRKPVIIGTNAAKDRISSCLGREEPGPGYMHFPAERDAGYFTQLTGERLVIKYHGTTRYRKWEAKKGMAHEALDCRVYAYAALCGLKQEHRLDLEREAERTGAATDVVVVKAGTSEAQRIEAERKQAVDAPVSAPAPAQPVPQARQAGGWMSGGRAGGWMRR